MSRSIRVLVGLLLACVVGLAAGAVQPAAAAPVDDPVRGLMLTGVCPTSPDASKDVLAAHPVRLTWTPYVVLDQKMTPIALLFPYQVTFSGVGLKSRHFVPGGDLHPVGTHAEEPHRVHVRRHDPDGPIHVDVNGTGRESSSFVAELARRPTPDRSPPARPSRRAARLSRRCCSDDPADVVDRVPVVGVHAREHLATRSQNAVKTRPSTSPRRTTSS